ncbi:MAG: hypothetical protein GY778_01905 [bacterium]|nr:hypothetical protein [bacterium]
MNGLDVTHEEAIALARSAAYGLIGRAFQYPDEALLTSLAFPDCWSSWPGVLGGINAELGLLLEHVRQAVGSAAADPGANAPGLTARFDELFGHSVRGKCPAYELEYGRSEIIQQASQLADLAGFYNAFGLEIIDDTERRPDHITVECEFMGALCDKEAYAIRTADAEHVEVCLDAQRSFLRDHLACWLPGFAHRVDRADSGGLYGALARFAGGFITAECDRFEIRPGPKTLKLRPTDPVADRSIACGPAECGTPSSGDRFVQLGVDAAPPQEQ